MITVCSKAAGCCPEHAQQLSATASNTAKLRAAFGLKSCAVRTMHLCTLLRGEEEKILPQLQRAAKSWQEPNRSSEKPCARDKKICFPHYRVGFVDIPTFAITSDSCRTATAQGPTLSPMQMSSLCDLNIEIWLECY